jgi:hypothetical protein
LHGPFYKIEDK